MTLSLLALSDNEHEIYKRTVHRYNGNSATKEDWQEDKLIMDNYKAIHLEYLKIFHEGNNEGIKLEALKRLIFLNWYMCVEPDWLTGIYELDERAIFDSYKILNGYISACKLDAEFTWMLSYYATWDYVILPFVENNLLELIQFVKAVDIYKRHAPEVLPEEVLTNRGRMAIYWAAIGN